MNCQLDLFQVLAKTAKILRDNGYDCEYRATIKVKGLSAAQKVYTVIEPQKNVNPVNMRRNSIAIHSFDHIVMRLLSNPGIRAQLKNNTSISESSEYE